MIPSVALAQDAGIDGRHRLPSAHLAFIAQVVLLLAVVFVSIGFHVPVHPNVILVSLDTVRADHLPTYGYQRDTAPALASFAQRSIVFDHAYSQAPNTVPTHASMFTGRFPFQHRMYFYSNELPPAEVTIAEYLRDRGYYTFGLASSVRFEVASGYGQGFAVWESFDGLPKNDRTAQVNARARELAARANGRPFFAFLHYFDAHGPYAPPAPYRSLWHSGRIRIAPEATVDYMLEHRHDASRVPRNVLAYLMALYDGAIRYLDTGLAELFATFQQAPNGRPTLWVITADHGEAFDEHGVLLHSDYLFEEMLRIPLIIAMPGRIPGGARVQTPVQSADLFPTIAELAGFIPPHVAGRSVAATVYGQEVTPSPGMVRDILIVEATPQWGIIGTLPSGRFKWTSGGHGRLFKLDVDPNADHDVAAKYAGEAKALVDAAVGLGVLKTTTERRAMAERIKAQQGHDSKVIERLRALGYVDEVDGPTPRFAPGS